MPSGTLLHRVAASTEGFAGADLQALCTAAVMAAISRAAPTLVEQLCDTSEDQEQHHPNQQQQQLSSQQQHLQQHLSSQQQQQQQDVADHPQLQHEQLQQLHQQAQHEQQPVQAQQPQPGPNQVDEQSNMQEQPKLHPQHGAMHKKGQQKLPGSLSRKLPWKLLEKLKVKAVDWQAALAAAPRPCSARQNISALSSGHAQAMPHHMVPGLLPALTTALRCITSAQLPWQGPIASALEAAGEGDDACDRQEQEEIQDGRQKSRLEAVLTQLGAIEAPFLHQSGMRLSYTVCLFLLACQCCCNAAKISAVSQDIPHCMYDTVSFLLYSVSFVVNQVLFAEMISLLRCCYIIAVVTIAKSIGTFVLS